MSRIRSVHPGFFRDDRLVPCSAFARLLFIGLGVEADDKGIFEWKPVTLKMSIFPGDNVDVNALLAELVAADAVMHFEAKDRQYGAIRNFRKYQKPKTPNDVHPMPDYVADFVAFPQKSEPTNVDGGPFPRNGEKPPQMEEGGGRREEPPKPPTGGRRSSRGVGVFFKKADEEDDGNERSQEGTGGNRADAGRIPEFAIADHRGDG